MKRDRIYALLLGILSILLMDCLLWSSLGLGAMLALISILALSTLYLWPKRRHFTAYTASLLFFSVTLATGFLFSDQGFIKFLSLMATIVLYTLFLTDMMDVRRHEAGTYRSAFDWFYTGFALSFGKIAHAFRTLFPKENSKNRTVGRILLGCALALPALLIIVPLLVSSDAAFEGLIRAVTIDTVLEIVCALIFGFALFILLFGRLSFLPTAQREATPPRERRGMDGTIVTAFLGMISLAYLLYLFSQLAYFFNAFSGLLEEGFTVAEYARRGFFEMTAVCAINLILLGLCAILCRKKNGKRPVAVTALLSFIGLFSLLLIAVSLSKMFLYIDSFGLTHLRLYTSLFMLVLAVLFIGILLRLYLPRIPYFKPAVCIAALLLTLLNFADADRLVAAYNVSAYRSGKLETVDVQSLNLDSDAVIPYLEQLTHDSNPNIVHEAHAVLTEREKPYTNDWRSFNLPSFQNRNSRSISAVFELDCKEDIYSVTFEYCLDRQLLGGQSISQGPDMSQPLDRDILHYVRFDARDFPNPDAVFSGQFGILVYVTLSDGKSIPIETLYEWNAQYGQQYIFTLSGNSTDGFTLEPMESYSSFTKTPASDLPADWIAA